MAIRRAGSRSLTIQKIHFAQERVYKLRLHREKSAAKNLTILDPSSIPYSNFLN